MLNISLSVIVLILFIKIIFIQKTNNVLNFNLKTFYKDINILKEKLQTTETEAEFRYSSLFKSWKITEESKIRKDALERSRSILRGQATEHLAPLTMDSLNPKDFRFMGNPIDYIVFNGLSDVSDKKSDEVESVILLDIKTGKSRLTKTQRRIRDCIEQGRVKFVVYNPDKDDQDKLESLLS